MSFRVVGPNEVAAAYAQMEKAQAAAATGAGLVNEKLELTSRQAKSLDKLQQDIARRNETASERYVRKLEEARRALAGHRNEAELLRRETGKLTAEYLRATDGGKSHHQAQEAALRKAGEKAKLLNAEIRKLPPLLQSTAIEARGMGAGLDLGAKSAKKTKEELLGIKTQQGATFGASAIAKIGAWGAGFLSVHQALQLVTQEMQLQQELLDKRAQSQLSVGEARNQLLRTLVGSSDADVERAMAASARIAQDTGVSEAKIAPALADAISAIGGDVGKAEAATRVAARYMAGSPDQITEFAGSLLDVSKATGTSNATTNLGLYQLLGKISRVNDPNMMQQTIPGALAGMASFGADFRESGATFAALSNASSDKFGRSTRTASVRLADQLGRFTREKFGKDIPFTDQVRALQGDNSLFEEFFAKRRDGGFGATFEAKSLGAVRELLRSPTSGASTEFWSAMRQIPNLQGLNAEGTNALGMFSRFNNLEHVGQRRRGLTSGLEQLQIDMAATGALSAEEREDLKKVLMEAGFSGLGSKFQNFVTGLGDGSRGLSAGSALEMLRAAEAENQGLLGDAGSGSGTGELTGEAARRDAILERLIQNYEAAEALRVQQLEMQRRQAEAAEETARNTRDGGGLVGGAS